MLCRQTRNPIEQKLIFNRVKVPRQVVKIIKNKFINKGNVLIFTYVYLLSKAYKDKDGKIVVMGNNFITLAQELKITLAKLNESLFKLINLNLIETRNNKIIIIDEEAIKYNSFSNPKIKKVANSDIGFIFVPKSSIEQLKADKVSVFSEADIVMDIFLQLVFNDKKIPESNRTGVAIAYFEYGIDTSFKKLADTYKKSKSTIHETFKKCDKENLFKAQKKKQGSIIVSKDYINLYNLNFKIMPNSKGEFLEIVDY